MLEFALEFVLGMTALMMVNWLVFWMEQKRGFEMECLLVKKVKL